jgi:sulfatase modifying factor 1
MRFCIASRVFGPWLQLALIPAICFATACASAVEPFSGAMKAGEERAYSALKMKFCYCPASKFKMGSPAGEAGHQRNEDQVDVTLTHGYWLGQHEVTQGQWNAVMSTTPWKGRRDVKEGSDYPAVHVSWEDAMSFCQKLTEKERSAGRLPRDWEYTLPTEAQWETTRVTATRNQFP